VTSSLASSMGSDAAEATSTKTRMRLDDRIVNSEHKSQGPALRFWKYFCH
jgi:hypothetical protein